MGPVCSFMACSVTWDAARGMQQTEIALTVAAAQLLSKPNTCRYRALAQSQADAALSADKRTQRTSGPGTSQYQDEVEHRT